MKKLVKNDRPFCVFRSSKFTVEHPDSPSFHEDFHRLGETLATLFRKRLADSSFKAVSQLERDDTGEWVFSVESSTQRRYSIILNDVPIGEDPQTIQGWLLYASSADSLPVDKEGMLRLLHLLEQTVEVEIRSEKYQWLTEDEAYPFALGNGDFIEDRE